MGLDLTSLVGNAFDIVEQVTSNPNGKKVVDASIIRKVTGTTYNTSTGKPVETVEDDDVQAIWTKATQKELDGIVEEKETAKVLIPSASVANKPNVNDQIVRSDGTTWDIRKTPDVPGESLITLIVLKRG